MFLSSQYTCTCKLLGFFFQMKKDYLEEGAMADTADLVVLGAYYGTGNKGKVMTGYNVNDLLTFLIFQSRCLSNVP